MAKYGTRYPVYAVFDGDEPTSALPTYGTGAVMGKLASVNITLDLPEAKYYADDSTAESATEFISGSGSIECDDISNATRGALNGANIDAETGEVKQSDTDEAPYFGFGFVVSKMISAEKKYEAHYYPKCKAKPSGVSATTKGQNMAFTGETLDFEIFNPNFGGWHYYETFDDLADAKAYINTYLNVSAQAQSAGGGGTGNAGGGGTGD